MAEKKVKETKNLEIPGNIGEEETSVSDTTISEESPSEKEAEKVIEEAEQIMKGEIPKNDAAVEKETASQKEAATARRRPDPVKHFTYRPEDVITVHKTAAVEMVNEEDTAWHELKNSYISRKALSGVLSSVEKMRYEEHSSVMVAVANYKGCRVVIPINEMNIVIDGKDEEKKTRQIRIASNMIGSEIDFIVKAIDDNNRSVVASRKDAMLQKVHDFYREAQADGEPLIKEGSVVEARVVAVSDIVLRLEIFGAECFVRSLDMENAWMGDARDKYQVGDIVKVRMDKITIDADSIRIVAEGKSISPVDTRICTAQSKYLGTVVGESKGIYFIRLKDGVNAIAHKCEAQRMPVKNDLVKFACTRMDEESHVAIGILTGVIGHRR